MKLVITDQHDDDFILDVISVYAKDGDVSRHWRIPRRLMMRPDVSGIVIEEIQAEVNEARTQQRVRELVRGR